MKKQWKCRLLSGILTVCLVLGQGITPIPAYAEGVSAGSEAVCPHHVHDADCGYTEGTPCAHQHTEDCYISVENCVHQHTEDCYPKGDVSDNDITQADKEPTACTHVCSEESGCITKELNCRHEHDGECGYTEGSPCTFDPADCEICNPADEGKDVETGTQEQCSCDTRCTEEQINTACPVCGATDADLTACKGEPAEDVLPDAVKEVQALIDALPDADAITAENAESVGELLSKIDAAKAELTDAELELLDLTRYIAAVDALGGLDRPALLADTPVTTWTALRTAINNSEGTEEEPAVIYVSGTITAANKMTVSAGKYVKIVGIDSADGEKSGFIRSETFPKGSSISNGENLFSVSGYLALENVFLDGNGTGTPGNYKGLVYITGSNAKAVLGAGAVLRNNDDSAVVLKDSATAEQEAVFVMEDGSEISGNVSKKGAAVWMANYGYSSFIMNGGIIQNNEVTGDATQSGGAAIYATAQGKICINGGKIVNNTATDASYGGAIRMDLAVTEKTELIMTGGEISGNTMTNSAGMGGGIYAKSAIVTITGGTIQDNSAGTGQNVYVNGGTFNMGGDANIPDGLFLELYNGTKEKAKFYITSALNHTTEIEGLTTTPSEGRVVARGTDAHTVTAEDCAKLSYTYGDMSLVLDEENNQIVLGYPAETVQVTFDKVVTSYNTTYRIYGNGIPLIIKEGTSGSSYTVIYVDSDGDGAVTDADIWAPEGLNPTAAGNRYSTCYIFGGGKDDPLEADTSVTMLGGKVTSIFGGSYSSTVDGNTKVVIHGGTVGSVYGAGQLASSRVTGDTQVIMDGGTVGNGVYGGGYDGTVGGNTSVAVTGGTVTNYICGGSNGTSGGTSGGEIDGNTEVVFGGTAVACDIMGGSYFCGTVGGNADLTITGGTIKEAVYGSGYEGKVTGNVTISITGGTVGEGKYNGAAINGVYGTSYRSGNSVAVGGNVSVSIKNASVLGCVRAKGCFEVDGSVSLTVGGTARIGTEAATSTIYYNGIVLNGGRVEDGIDSFVVEPDLTGDAKLYLFLPDGYVCINDPVVATQGIQDDISHMELTGQTTVPDGMGLYLDGTNIYIGYPKVSVTDIAIVTTGTGANAEIKTYSYGDGADYATADEAVRAAWDYAKAQSKAVTVKLLDDVELTGLLTLSNSNADLTLEMEEGAVLSRTEDTNGQGPLITVSAGKLTVAGGMVESLTDSRDNAVKVSGDGTLDITGGTLRSKGYVVYNDGGKVNMTGGLLELEYVTNSEEGCLYTTGDGTSNISGGKMEGVFTVAVASGTVNVSGDAEIIASIDWIGGGVYGIYLDSDGSGSDPVVNISGGTISTSTRGHCVRNNSGSGVVTISGGTFKAGREGICVSMSDRGTLSVTDGTFTTPLNLYGDGVQLSGTATADITGGTIITRRGVLVGDNASVSLGGTAKVDGNLYGVYAESSGKVEIGGTAEISGDTAGVYVKENGIADISGGTISGGDYGLFMDGRRANAILSGGTFTGNESSLYTSDSTGAVENFLAEGYAYYEGTAAARGPLISDGEILTGSTLAAADGYGTVTVAKFLLTVTSQPVRQTTRTYGYTDAPVLRVVAQSDGKITYQWYQVGEKGSLALAEETGSTLRIPGLEAGDYQYYCAVSSGSYTVNSNMANVTVKKKEITVTADDKKKIYGEADPAFTYTAGTLVNGDTLTGITVAREAGETVGEYELTASQTEGSNPNYAITFEAGTLTITPKEITVNITANGGTYNGTIVPASAELSGVIEGDTVPVTLTYTGTANTGEEVNSTVVPKLAGTYTVTASIENDNYKLTGDNTAEFVVQKAESGLSVSAVSEKTYGDPAFELEVMKNSDGALSYESSDEKVVVVTGGKVTIVGAGTATITVNVAETANYRSGTADVTFTVARKDAVLTVEKVAYEVTYGDADFTIEGITSEGESGIEYESDNPRAVTVGADGTVHIVGAGEAKITLTMAESGNYNEAETSVTVTVKKKAVTVTADDKKKIYGEADPAFTYTTGTLVNGDTLTGITVEREAGENAGKYEISASQTEGSNPNYAVTFEAGTLTITPKEITVNITANGGTYNGTIVPASAELSGVIEGDMIPVTLTYTGTANTGEEVNSTVVPTLAGTYTVTASIENDNYKLTGDNTAEFVVQKAESGLSVGSVLEKTYGDPAFELEVIKNSDGALSYVSSDEKVAVVTDGKVTIVGTGTATITVNVAETANYVGGTANVTFTVARKDAALTVEKTAYEVTYGDADFTIEGIVSEGESNIVYESDNPEAVTVDADGTVHIVGAGEAKITLTMAESGNYNEAETSVTVTVKKKVVTVTADDKKKIYGEADPAFTYTTGTLVNEDTLTGITVAREAGETAGEYEISASQTEGSNPNYAITFESGTFTIEQREAELTWGNTSFIYNGEVQKPEAAIKGLLAGDSCSVTVTGGQKNAGSYTATATALDNENYKLPENVTTAFEILQKEVTVTITPNGGTYGGMITPAEAELSGVIAGDTVPVTLTYSGKANDGTEINSVEKPALAGTYIVTAAIEDGNYRLTGSNTAEYTVSRAASGLSVSAVAEKTYGDPAFELEVIKNSDGALSYVSSDEKVAVVTDGKVTIVGTGTATITVNVAETANYRSGTANVTFTVVRKNAVLTVEKVAYEVTYGDADFTIDGIKREGESGIVYESDNPDVVTVDEDGTVHIVGAGEAKITLTMEESDNYNEAETSVTVTVKKKAITVTADDRSKIYGDADPELTYIVSGLVNGDTLTGIAAAREAGENAGEYEITFSQTEGLNPNYAITFESGTFTIEQRAAELTWGSTSFIYNGEIQKPEAAVKGLLAGDTCSVTVTGGRKNAGSYTATAAALDNGNYKLPENVTTAFEILQKEVTVTITPNGGTYGGMVTPAEAELSGVIAGDTVPVTLTYSGKANDGTEINSVEKPALAGTYIVTAAIEDGNYRLTGSNTAEYTVSRAASGLSVSAVAEKTYGDPAFELEVIKNSDGALSYESSDEKVAVVTNGKVTIVGTGTVTITVNVAETANYVGGTANVTFTVVRKNAVLTVEKVAYEVTYGDADFTIEGITSEGESGIEYESDNPEAVTVDADGTVHIVGAGEAKITLTMEESDNYNEAETSVTVTVKKKAITVTANDRSKIYGDADPELIYTVGGLVNGDTLTGIAAAREAGENAGEYEITLSQPEGANPNYAITFADGTFTIEQRAAELTWSNTSFIYNGEVQKPEASVKGLLAGDSCNVTVTGGQKNAGSYTATATALDNENYKLPENVTTAFEILQKEVTVTITPNGGTYGTTITPATAELNGVVAGDTVPVTLTYTGKANNGEEVNSIAVPKLAGTYTVTATIEDGNYKLTGDNTAEFVVQKADAGLSVSAVAEKIYGDPAFELEVKKDSDGALSYESSDEKVAVVTDGKVTIVGAGTATITVSVAETANYLSGTADVTFTAERKNAALTVEKVAYEVTYGDADFTIDGIKREGESGIVYESDNPDVVTVDEDGTVHIVGAGEAKITLTMEESDNYNEAETSVTVTVKKKAVTVTADDKKKIYGEADPAFTYTTGVLVNGDTLTGITVEREAGENAGKYEITLSQPEGANPNYAITFADGTFTIEQRAAELTWSNTSFIYNGEVQKPEASVKGLLAGDSCNVTVTGGQKNAGSYTATATALDNENYKLPENVTTAFEILQKEVTVTITPNGGTYGTTITPAEAELSGVIAGDTVPVTLTYSGKANDGTEINSVEEPALAGTYIVTAAIEDGNYRLTGSNTAEYTVSRAASGLSVSAVAEKTYGDPAFELEVIKNSDGALSYESSDEKVAVVTDGKVSIVGAGTATITVNVAETANYSSGTLDVTFTVVRKNAVLTVEKVAYEVTYGDADFTIEGITSEGESSIEYESDNPEAVTVDADGTVHIVGAGEAKITLTMAESGNYNEAETSVTVTVKKKEITVTADDKKKIYGEKDQPLTWKADGLVGKDEITGIGVMREAGEDVGEYIITAYQENGTNSNYTILFVSGMLLIEARDIADADVKLGAALIANGKSQIQGIESVTVKNTDGEEMAVTYNVTGNEGTKPGTYLMTITGTGNFTGVITKEFVIAAAATGSEEEESRDGDTSGDKSAAEPWVWQEAGTAVTEKKENEGADGEAANGVSLQTGDSANSGLWIFAFCISLCMLACTLFRKRRDEKEN